MAVVVSMASSSVCLARPSLVILKTRTSSRTRIGGVLGSSLVPRTRMVARMKSLKVNASLEGCARQGQPAGEKFGGNFFLVLESMARNLSQIGENIGNAMPKFKPHSEGEMLLLTALKGRMVCAAAPIFLAAISQSAPVNTPLTVVASGMAKWLELYSGVLMVRVLLSWFPNIPWERQPLQAMRDMCDPYLNLFRNIIPPLFNALDLSPMLAFLVLGVLTSILNTTVQSG